ncbi:hypothetical protein [Corynebacterium aquilae]|uniref:Lipoprotein n=1 Tax=Corynebacterium aquilae DSM 44791 TaxID=1431546 RepID=A0A1L7CHF9_9CORY|nr:hypothetical protein [Corynebacterium aquilae]APT85287.1 hypothetical protein CAQU_09630 [Corynebacterium aquilae DSM 44791]
MTATKVKVLAPVLACALLGVAGCGGTSIEDLPPAQASFARTLPTEDVEKFLDLSSDAERTRFMSNYSYDESSLTPSELAFYKDLSFSEQQRFLRLAPSERSDFVLDKKREQEAQRQREYEQQLRQQEYQRQEQQRQFERQQQQREAEQRRAQQERERQQQQQQQQRQQQQQQQQQRQQQQQQAWPDPPYPAPGGNYPMEWATLGPYASQWTCDQATSSWPADASYCFSHGGSWYYYGLRQAR